MASARDHPGGSLFSAVDLGSSMRTVFGGAVAWALAFFASFAQAASEDGAALAPELTVSAMWVVVFLLVFVGICAWIGFAIWRHERKNAVKREDNAKA
jgi:cbb3-type cytochrome oxidase subunit 3